VLRCRIAPEERSTRRRSAAMARKEVKSEITGAVWKITRQQGDQVAEEDEILILESMKMEIPVLAETRGTIVEILVKEGDAVAEGQAVAIVEVG
jgi:acetyl-CoA carboxylase biotin carboxyl carrier protein